MEMSCEDDEDLLVNNSKLGNMKRLLKEDRVKWSAQQDNILSSLAVAYGAKNWNAIASCMNENFPSSVKTSKQCRERWHYCLDLKIDHKPWTKQEEATLLLVHMNYGNRWCDIASHLKGRHNNMIKNRFYSILRKVKNRIRNDVYTSQDQLEVIEMHYMTSVMINYIKNPIPAEDLRRRRGRDFMHTLVNDITVDTLENFNNIFLTYHPLKEPLKVSLQRITESDETRGKTKASPASGLLRRNSDAQTDSLDSNITLQHILEFCWGSKNMEFVLPKPTSFIYGASFSQEEKNLISKELLPQKLSDISFTTT